MNNKKTKSRTLLVFLAAMAFMLPCMTSCEWFFNADFNIENPSNDTIVFLGWKDTTGTTMTCPYTSPSGDVHSQVSVCYQGRHGGPHGAYTEEEAFNILKLTYDSVQIIRRPSNAATITYRHDEQATEAQRYFFTREAWDATEGSTYYTLKLTDEMFH